MASNPYVNRVYKSDGTKIMDISEDDVTANDVRYGKYFHLASGQRTTGTMSVQTYYTGSSDPSSSLGSDGDLYFKE